MIIEIRKKDDSTVRVGGEDFRQVTIREHVYKMPFEIRIIYKQRVYSRRLERLKSNAEPIEMIATFTNGHEIEVCIHKLEHREDGMAMISMIHKDIWRIMNNRIKNGENILGVDFSDLVSYDHNTYWFFREELAKTAQIINLKYNYMDYKLQHITDWHGRDVKVIKGIFRKVDIDMQDRMVKHAVYNKANDWRSTTIGDTREVLNFRFEKWHIDGLSLKLIPNMSVLAIGEHNLHFRILNKVKFGDIEYAVMGMQKVWKNHEVICNFILGREAI